MSHGMAEAVPTLLSRRLSKDDREREHLWALRYVLQAVVGYEAVDDITSVRNTFQAARGLFDTAKGTKTSDAMQGVAATLSFVMGQIESRAGALDRAREHLAESVQIRGTSEALALLSAIDRQKGNGAEALRSLSRIVKTAEEEQDFLRLAETELVLSELHQAQGRKTDAQAALGRALTAALAARNRAQSSGNFAGAERALARVLERYGEAAAARRATERAFEASRNDMREFTATVLDSCRRALTLGDLGQAREAVRRALAANLAPEDLVYCALWLQLLEQQLGVASDGTVDDALIRIDDHLGWPTRLRDWARGKVSDVELVDAAANRVQRVEALFYVAMDMRNDADQASEKQAADARLAEVAESEAIELVEVAIARDLLTQSQGKLDASVPSGVDLP
jgi:tetratricopeptide (TPR) repeat protein